MNNIGKRLMPIYLIKFLEENYFDIIPENFGRRMVSRQFIAEIKALYDEFDGKPIDNYGRRMVPEYLIKAFSDIEYIEYTDNDVKYEKTVPTGALKYATLDMLGGMSYKSENLIALADVEETTNNGITYKVQDGVLYLNGTATSNFSFGFNLVNAIPIGTYASIIKVVGTTTSESNWLLSNTIYSGNDYSFGKADGATNTATTTQENTAIRIYVASGAKFTNYQVKLMLVTGSTAPIDYQPYFTGIRDSAVTSVVAKKTYEIDEHILALDGYGIGVNDTCYNYIDYENKKFIQKVAIIDLGSLTYEYNGSRFRGQLSDIKLMSSTEETPKGLISNDYKILSNNDYSTDQQCLSVSTTAPNSILIRDNNYTSTDDLKAALDGVIFYYELATPVETDISDYIKDNFIEVEPTGYVTFTNEYEQAVPSEVTYLIKE